MEWAKGSYREGLMRGRGELRNARSILIMDNLHAQTTDEFKEYLAKECNTLAWYGPSECTDEVQPVDAGAGRFIKVEAGRQMDIWLEQSDNLERWETAALTASGRRAFRFRLFEKCGMAMTVDGSGDDRITLEGPSQTQTDELALLDDDDSMDPQDPEGETQGMEIPTGFRIQEVKPVALDRLL
ncbi:unnamed protein product [Ectocarpus sp. CCAP 1310/34]|nr:unnamed protein product [Ectocarpus sp. CCAP 1310/34]